MGHLMAFLPVLDKSTRTPVTGHTPCPAHVMLRLNQTRECALDWGLQSPRDFQAAQRGRRGPCGVGMMFSDDGADTADIMAGTSGAGDGHGSLGEGGPRRSPRGVHVGAPPLVGARR